jgi:tripeptide aminopeptidase
MTELRTLTKASSFATARDVIHQTDDLTVEDMCAATAIAAPTGAESNRGTWFAGRLAEYGLSAEVDDVGNVIAVAPSADPDAPWVVVASHLDTVFRAGTVLDIRRSDGRIAAPGISDNSRGLAGLLAIARGLQRAGWPAGAPIAFIGTVGEEGAGDLRGAKHFVARNRDRIGSFIALDGAGAHRIIRAGVGSRRLRVTFTGPGGHSWSDWGNPNAIHAAGAAIARLAALELPKEPRTTLSVGRIGGGTTVNAIPSETWLEIDLRSEELAPLQELERRVREILATSATGEQRGSLAMTCDIEVFGDRPAGSTPADHPLVRLAEDATRAIGFSPELASSSTDANVAMAAAIPAIAIGAGGEAGGTHTEQEWYENDGGVAGVERALMIVLGAAGVVVG